MKLTDVLECIHGMVWGPWTLVVFLGTGIYLSIRFGFFQIRGFPFWWSATAGSLAKARRAEQGGVSQFQSVCTALAATVGTGNIAGVATALAAGGPGALFWMWISACIGMITAYGETALGACTRREAGHGKYLCGPFVYMEQRLGARWMGLLYGFLCLMCSLGMGSMVQSNAALGTMAYAWHIPLLPGGIVFTALLGAVILGGIRRIGSAAEKIMPAVSGIYIFFCLLVLAISFERIPGVLCAVFASAFEPASAAGGTGGYLLSRSLRYGVSRGVFSNEAGLGTLAILHGAADRADPRQQGMWAMFEVFFDTVVLCTLTGLVILCAAGTKLGESPYQGAALAAWSFQSCLGPAGGELVSASVVVFAFATIMAWYYMGKQAACYLSGGLSRGASGKRSLFEDTIYPILFLGAVFAGSQAQLDLVWLLSDIWNGLMAFPNLTALLFLAGEIELPDWSGKARVRGIRTEEDE